MRPTRVRHGVFALSLLLVAIAYLDRVCISTAAPAIQHDLGLDSRQMGYVFSAFTLAYALFEIPGGWFADRFGARIALTRVVLWWSALTAATGLAVSFPTLVAVRFLFGMGEAGAFPSTARVYARWLPVGLRGRAFGLLLMIGTSTGAVTQPLVVALIERMSWRAIFPLFGAVGIVWAAAWWWYFRDDPRRHPHVNPEEVAAIGAPDERPAHERHPPWAALARNRTLGALCLMYFGTIYGWYFYLTWLPTYLLKARGFDLKHAGMLASLPLLGLACGVAIGGTLSDVLIPRLGRRLGRAIPGMLGGPLAALAISAAVLTRDPLASAWLFGLGAALSAMGVPCGWAVCLEIGAEHAGVVTGTMNTAGNMGGALLPLVIGYAVDALGSWDASLLSVAAFYLVAGLSWLLIDPDERLQLGAASPPR